VLLAFNSASSKKKMRAGGRCFGVIIRGQNVVMIIKYQEREKEGKKEAPGLILKGVN